MPEARRWARQSATPVDVLLIDTMMFVAKRFEL